MRHRLLNRWACGIVCLAMFAACNTKTAPMALPGKPVPTPVELDDPADPLDNAGGTAPKQALGDGREVAALQKKNEPPRFAEVEEKKNEVPPEPAPPIPAGAKALNPQKTLFIEPVPGGGRRILLLAQVVLREGPLEVFLCRKMTKEHESILAADVDAAMIHAALIAAGAKPGTPVQFVNPKTEQAEYRAATGTPIRVSVTYLKGGKVQNHPAQKWIEEARTKLAMSQDWVFAGSRFFQNPDDPKAPPYYCANNGEVISIANFPDAMLDLPVKSSREAAELGFTAVTERIPPVGTPVLVALEMVPAKK